MRIRRMTAPPDLRDFDEKIAQVRRDKESAIDAQDFERAAQLRDTEKQLLAQKAQREKEWKAGDLDVVSEVDDEQIAEVLANWTGIPVYKLTEEETARLLRMEDELHKRIIGQEDAVKAVSQAIRRTRAGLKDPKRPSGSFIFAGPSGVGKTELSKALAEFLFGSEDALIQLDMSRVPRPVHGLPAGRCPSRVRRATTRVASSPRRCAAGRSRWSCSTRSRRPTRTCSTRCCRSWRTVGSPTVRAASSTSRTR